MTKDFERRRTLTFSQAAGLAPLPRQLQPGELPKSLRVRLWRSVHATMSLSPAGLSIIGSWTGILRDFLVEILHERSDKFHPDAKSWFELLGELFETASLEELFDALIFFLRHPNVPRRLADGLQADFEVEMAPYRIYERDTIVPVGSEQEAITLGAAFADLEKTEFNGARQHLKSALDHLSRGKAADSIRESIHAVEAVAKAIDPKANTLNDALRRLVSANELDKLLSQALDKLYAWTSNEQGVRHSLVFSESADVDDADAQFMAGACAAFVSYLINRARVAKLI